MINQYRTFALFSACYSVFAVGCTVGWTTCTISELTGGSSIFRITKSQSSWLASINQVGHAMSPLPAGILLSTQGRARPVIYASIIGLLGWVLVLAAKGVVTLYFAGLMFGLSMGIVFTVVPLYIAELSPDRTRGALITMFQVSLTFGHLVEFISGPFMTYYPLGILSTCFTAVWVTLAFFMMESPVYLVQSGQVEKAEKTIKKLAPFGLNVDEEIVKYEKQAADAQSLSTWSRFKILFSSFYRRKLFVLCMIDVAQRFTGMVAIVAYANSTFPDTKGFPHLYTMIFGAVGFVFSFASAALIDSLGRRPLGLVSTAGCAITNLSTAVYFYFYPTNDDSFSWLPVVTITLFSVLYALGLGPLVDTLRGELFPPSVKGVASGVCTIVDAASSLIVTKLFQVIRDDGPGIYLDFLIFAAASVVSTIFVYFYLPETKRLPLIETEKPDVKKQSTNTVN